jgi:thiol-disulfide isomerase/thioredoxin
MKVPSGAQLTLLSRAYCHLCDEMAAALAPLAARFGAAVTVVDVDADPALEARYGELVPVLLLGDPADGAKLCHYRLDAAAVTRALAAQQPPASGD